MRSSAGNPAACKLGSLEHPAAQAGLPPGWVGLTSCWMRRLRPPATRSPMQHQTVLKPGYAILQVVGQDQAVGLALQGPLLRRPTGA